MGASKILEVEDLLLLPLIYGAEYRDVLRGYSLFGLRNNAIPQIWY
jgi:hypothetical protein